MKCNALWVVLMVVPALTGPAQAGLFGKNPPPKPDPMIRVPQLLFQVKMDPAEKKRVSAIEELREFDPKKFQEIAPILVDVMQNDKAATVRSEAAHSLGRIRPVSMMAAKALENTSHKDAVMRVRMQAWTSLRMIHLAGAYPTIPKDGKNPGKDGTILLTNQGKDNPQGVILVPYSNNPSAPPPAGTINQTSNIPRPLPSSPSGGFSTAVPSQSLRVNTPPPGAVDGGPVLAPPASPPR
jgi:hypothetical protein